MAIKPLDSKINVASPLRLSLIILVILGGVILAKQNFTSPLPQPAVLAASVKSSPTPTSSSKTSIFDEVKDSTRKFIKQTGIKDNVLGAATDIFNKVASKPAEMVTDYVFDHTVASIA